MLHKHILHTLAYLKSLQLPTGGFPYYAGEQARPDATAWAVLTLNLYDEDAEICHRGRRYLSSLQSSDGRISVSPVHQEASWPTPLAIMAWQGFPQYQEAKSRAINYLLKLTGEHFANPNYSAVGHDTSIEGWPWVTGTHSWVVPTALCLVALQEAGLVTHPRMTSGRDLLLDRQLTNGGWNYGSTTVFQRELSPLPECTGIALQALSLHIEQSKIERSLQYIQHELPNLRTPLSLGWALLGLSAWGWRPEQAEDLVLASLEWQERYGRYPVPSLALLLCAGAAAQGLHTVIPASSEMAAVSASAH